MTDVSLPDGVIEAAARAIAEEDGCGWDPRLCGRPEATGWPCACRFYTEIVLRAALAVTDGEGNRLLYTAGELSQIPESDEVRREQFWRDGGGFRWCWPRFNVYVPADKKPRGDAQPLPAQRHRRGGRGVRSVLGCPLEEEAVFNSSTTPTNNTLSSRDTEK